MPKLLSGRVLRDGGSGQYISLPSAQPALGASPSTTTGFTLVTTPEGITSYSSSLGNIEFVNGSLTSYIPDQNITINGTGTSSTFVVNIPTVFNQGVVFANTFSFVDVTAVGHIQFLGGFNSTGTSNGTLVVQGGVGISEDVFIGGLLNVSAGIQANGPIFLDPASYNVSIQPTLGGTVTIKPDVAGDIDNMDIGSIVPRSGKFTTLEVTSQALITSTATSTSTTTGALVVTGGVGVGQDLRASKVFDNNVRVISTINTGAGLSGGGTGPTLSLTNTGVLSLTAGTGTFVNSTTGNIVVWTSGNTLQAVTEQGNTTDRRVFFNNTSNATTSTTGSVVIAGGLGVEKDIYLGGNIYAANLNPDTIRANQAIFTTTQITSLAADTSTVTLANNALYVAGGVGVGTNLTVGGNTLIYGNLTVFGTQTIVTSSVADIGRKVVALSTSAGPAILAIDSGITVGPVSSPFVKFLFDGINTWKSTGNIGPVTSGAYSLGSVSTPWAGLYSQVGKFSSTTPSTNPATGALTVAGGVGIGGDIYTSGILRSTNLTASTSTNTGAIVATGGLGLGGSAYIGGQVRIKSTTNSTSTTTGALQVAGGAGFQGAVYATNFYNAAGETFVTTSSLLTSAVVISVQSGTGTAVSTATGSIVVWSTSTLQTVTDVGATTNNIVSFTNTTDSTSTTTGAVTIAGGLAVKKSLYVGGDAVIYGNVTFTGTATNVLTTNTVFTDNLIELHKPNNGAWASDDGKDIGIKIHYYDTIDNFGFFGRSNASGYLEWLSTGTESGSTFAGTYGTFKTGVIRLVSKTTATNTTTGALIVQGGVGVGGNIYAYNIYSNGSQVLTAASIGSYGVSMLHAGTDTAVSDTAGEITVWNTSNLQSITERGSITTQPITVNNTLTVSGVVLFQDSLIVNQNIQSDSVTTNLISAATGTFTTVLSESISLTGNFVTTSSNQYPVRIISDVNTTSSYYAHNTSDETFAASSFVAENDAGNFIELGIKSSTNQSGLYDVGCAYLYVSTLTTTLNVGDSSSINFYTQGGNSNGQPTLSLDTTGTVRLVSDLVIDGNDNDNYPHATLKLTSDAVVAYSSITLENTGLYGQSYTLDVGGSYRAAQSGAAVNEGNFTLHDNVADAYRFIVTKNSGNILINTEVDDNVNKVQVVGSFTATGVVTANTGTFQDINVGIATVTGDLDLTGKLTVGTTATVTGELIVHSTSTFDTTVKIGSSTLETSVTPINTTDPTQIDSFDATLYRSARSVVQVTSGDDFHLAEIVLLHDNFGEVHKSEYGIILTNGALGEFSAVLDSGYVKLYFTAYNATTKTVNVVRTAIGV